MNRLRNSGSEVPTHLAASRNSEVAPSLCNIFVSLPSLRNILGLIMLPIILYSSFQDTSYSCALPLASRLTIFFFSRSFSCTLIVGWAFLKSFAIFEAYVFPRSKERRTSVYSDLSSRSIADDIDVETFVEDACMIHRYW